MKEGKVSWKEGGRKTGRKKRSKENVAEPCAILAIRNIYPQTNELMGEKSSLCLPKRLICNNRLLFMFSIYHSF